MRFLAFFLFLSAASAQVLVAQGRPAGVGVQEVEMRALAETVPVFAEVITARDGNVASRVACSEVAVEVLAGSRVAAGELLLELNDDLLRSTGWRRCGVAPLSARADLTMRKLTF